MTNKPVRQPAGGRIDRSKPLAFRLEKRLLQGYAGDTLASALLACGVRLLGRSLKYHRPRGILSAGIEEPNALVTVGEGARRTPNVAATVLELYDGLVCERQNGWPSVGFDVAAVLGWFAPLLGAGFYYKTFMGPRRGSWMFYEPFIRRTAGLGRATHEPDPDRYESRHAHADVLVVGAGPAGLAAARAAGRAGCRVLLVEQDFIPGGSALRAPLDSLEDSCCRSLAAELASLPNVEMLTRTTAFGTYDGQTVALLQRRDHARPDAIRGEAREVLMTVRARSIIYATGAIERPLIFADNDRPGVMLAGAVRTYLNRFALRLGQRAVLATNNDSAWATALDLAAAGTSVTLVDERPTAPAMLADAAHRAGVEVRLGTRMLRAIGGHALRGAELLGDGATRRERIACDLIGMSGGWSPTVHLTAHTGIRPVYDARLDSCVAGSLPAGVFAVGDVAGRGSTALADGHAAGEDAARHAGARGDAGDPPPFPGPAWPDGHLPSPPGRVPGRGKAFIDYQGDVTTDDIALAREEGYESVEHLKRYTALGMGTDQGKTSNVGGARLMAELRGFGHERVGATTFRPPYAPVSIGALAGRSTGAHFRPTRRTPMHDWHLANGATMIEAGPWLRPWYYRWAGAEVADAYVAEMNLVRSGVGISDISSLGKIDVQGPDAGEFLDRVYVNDFKKLAVGKARYGVMLNDDATVLDDGTTARFDQTTWFMTTTTAQAAEVMSWLEFLLQTAWQKLRVQVVSVTDRWAGMSVAGPKAREALSLALPNAELSNEALPHMGVRELDIEGIPVRLLRLSFSGELAYEVYVPADHGTAMWERILGNAASLGIRPYGLEALASLRIEKGHVAGLELDHRTTLDDLGLGRMASRTKPFVGCVLRQREELQSPERWQLVGLECIEPASRLRGGAILFASGDVIGGHGRGYITSVTWSTVHQKLIALALYQGGLRHEGEEIVCAFPLRNETVRARIVSPVFVDPPGERFRV
ncbi:MAG: sarcosine oxidase subunit alpha family protein [Proteobacteria bacterium]|nr:sarcosine oxidase subunit alpha family protein [Pseudomonadota bacterium]